MQPPRTTSRLQLDTPRCDDVAALFQFFGDASAMRFTQVSDNLDRCAALIDAHEQQRAVKGCAPWVIRERERKRIVGWGGLYEDPFDEGWGIELAYRFAPVAWGKGYATELAIYCLAVARDELRLSTVIAFSHPENSASHSVLRKAGFEEKKFLPEMNRHLFEVRFK
jgi:[ribosomal protein S5]-alanine N-acetyltransferase